MRLKKIKLSGFKSFVDPTILELKSPLVAVVGPNGCGKSNIIDAVRWVMGESSAKNLRGESMADVIFNGSSARKPVGQAQIELVFDNSDGSLGGEYARFNEISIRRLATRDGQSSYFLNNTRCRRKDITDIFLGTGLGPRSYAIIEQGMISRVIEARPEDLRAFLEEAAGVSLYRKRRHETETRMRHTRENLDRLNDVRQELEKQLDRLKRQSESAERYKLLKESQDRLEAELAALRWQVFNQQLQERTNSIRALSNSVEERLSVRSGLDLELEKLHVIHTEKIDAWKVEQAQFYDLGTQIARVEQTLQHHRERFENLQADLSQTEQNYIQTCSQIEQDEERLVALREEVAKLKPDLELAETSTKGSEKIFLEAEEAMRHWAENFETFQLDAEKPQRVAEVEKARIEQLEKQSREAKAQFDRLEKAHSVIDINLLENELATLENEKREQEQKGNVSTTHLNEISSLLNEERIDLKGNHEHLNEARTRLQRLSGRLASLEALQQASLGKTNTTIKSWLTVNGLIDYPRLGEVLVVEPGYERALETVLGSALEAVCVPDTDIISNAIGELKEGSLTFINDAKGTVSFVLAADLLLNKVKTDLSLESLLVGIYIVDELEDALRKQKTLKAGESVVTKDGIWLGPNWLRVYRGTDGHTGVLAREAELKEINVNISSLKNEIAELEMLLKQRQEKIAQLEAKRDALHKEQQTQGRFQAELASKISAARTRLEHARDTNARLQTEAIEQKQKLDFAEEEIALARVNLQAALDSMEVYSKKRVLLQTERDKLRELLQKASREAHEAKEKAHALALKAQNLTTQQAALEEGLNRLLKQQQTISERRSFLREQLQGLKAPEEELKDTLEDLLKKRIICEDTLNLSRASLEEVEQTLRSLEKKRNSLEQEIQETRVQLEQLRMDWQAIEVRCQTIQEKFDQSETSIEKVLEAIPSTATESAWAEELTDVTKRIERLGAINLAAIEEYQSELERKNYLDLQHTDLTEALETLENAIRKIDKETRARFKETFEKVNQGFQTLFPLLFGGGQATLELTGEDLLEAGISVIARPPGKRNSSIHLLSGGEKALTAVALVFAIFQLNPAPFCLLDEVDAPLDDANVGRFCELVKRLSDTVQFIFVTHNKLAMEMAHHLVGVTMKEAGVSRLVSVDVEAAAELVAS